MLLHSDDGSNTLLLNEVAALLELETDVYRDSVASNMLTLLDRRYLLTPHQAAAPVEIHLNTLLMHLNGQLTSAIHKSIPKAFYPTAAFDNIIEGCGSSWRKIITGKTINFPEDIRDLDFRVNLARFAFAIDDWANVFDNIRRALLGAISSTENALTKRASIYNSAKLQQGCFSGSDGSCGPYAFYRLTMHPKDMPDAPPIDLEFWVTFANTRTFSSANEALYVTLDKQLLSGIREQTLEYLNNFEVSADQVQVADALHDEFHKFIRVPNPEELGRLSALRVLRSYAKGYRLLEPSTNFTASIIEAILRREPGETLQGLQKFLKAAATPEEQLALLAASSQVMDQARQSLQQSLQELEVQQAQYSDMTQEINSRLQQICQLDDRSRQYPRVPQPHALLSEVNTWLLEAGKLPIDVKLNWLSSWLRAIGVLSATNTQDSTCSAAQSSSDSPAISNEPLMQQLHSRIGAIRQTPWIFWTLLHEGLKNMNTHQAWCQRALHLQKTYDKSMELCWEKLAGSLVHSIHEPSDLLLAVVNWSVAEDGVPATAKLAWLAPWLQAIELAIGKHGPRWQAWPLPEQNATTLLLESGVTTNPPLEILAAITSELKTIVVRPEVRTLLAPHIIALKEWCTHNPDTAYYTELHALSTALDHELMAPSPVEEVIEAPPCRAQQLMTEHPWTATWLADDPPPFTPELLTQVDIDTAQELFQEMWQAAEGPRTTIHSAAIEQSILAEITHTHNEALAWLLLATSGQMPLVQYALYQLLYCWQQRPEDEAATAGQIKLLLHSGCLPFRMNVGRQPPASDLFRKLKQQYLQTEWPQLRYSDLLLPPPKFLECEAQRCDLISALMPILAIEAAPANGLQGPLVWLALQLISPHQTTGHKSLTQPKTWKSACKDLAELSAGQQRHLLTHLAQISQNNPARELTHNCRAALSDVMRNSKAERGAQLMAAFLLTLISKHQSSPGVPPWFDDDLLSALFHLSEAGADISDLHDLEALIPELDHHDPARPYRLIKQLAADDGSVELIHHVWNKLEKRYTQAKHAALYQEQRYAWLSELVVASQEPISEGSSCATHSLTHRVSYLPQWPNNDLELVNTIEIAAQVKIAVQNAYEMLRTRSLKQPELRLQALSTLLQAWPIEHWMGHAELYFDVMQQRLQTGEPVDAALAASMTEGYATLAAHLLSTHPLHHPWPKELTSAAAWLISHPCIRAAWALSPPSPQLWTVLNQFMLHLMTDKSTQATAYKVFLEQKPAFCPDLSMMQIRTSYLAYAMMHNKLDCAWIERLHDRPQLLLELANEWVIIYQAIKEPEYAQSSEIKITQYLQQLVADVQARSVNHAIAVVQSLRVQLQHGAPPSTQLYNELHATLLAAIELCDDIKDSATLQQGLHQTLNELLSPAATEESLPISVSADVVDALPVNFIHEARRDHALPEQVCTLMMTALEALEVHQPWSARQASSELTDMAAKLRLDLARLLWLWQGGTIHERTHKLRLLLSCWRGGDSLEGLNALCRGTPSVLLVDACSAEQAPVLIALCVEIANAVDNEVNDTLITEVLYTMAGLLRPTKLDHSVFAEIWEAICRSECLQDMIPNELLIGWAIAFLPKGFFVEFESIPKRTLLEQHVINLLEQRLSQYLFAHSNLEPYHHICYEAYARRIGQTSPYAEDRAWATVTPALLHQTSASAAMQFQALHKLTQRLCLAVNPQTTDQSGSELWLILDALFHKNAAGDHKEISAALRRQSLSVVDLAINMGQQLDAAAISAASQADIQLLITLLTAYASYHPQEYLGWLTLLRIATMAFSLDNPTDIVFWQRILQNRPHCDGGYWSRISEQWTLEERLNLVFLLEPMLPQLLQDTTASAMINGFLDKALCDEATISKIPNILKELGHANRLNTFITSCLAQFEKDDLSVDEYMLAATGQYWAHQLKRPLKIPTWEQMLEALNRVQLNHDLFMHEYVYLAHRLIMFPAIQSTLSVAHRKARGSIQKMLNTVSTVYAHNQSALRCSLMSWGYLICPVLDKLSNCKRAVQNDELLMLHLTNIVLIDLYYVHVRGQQGHHKLSERVANIVNGAEQNALLAQVMGVLLPLYRRPGLSTSLLELLRALSDIINTRIGHHLNVDEGHASSSSSMQTDVRAIEQCKAFVAIKSYVDATSFNELSGQEIIRINQLLDDEMDRYHPQLIHMAGQQPTALFEWLNTVCANCLLNFARTDCKYQLLKLLLVSPAYLQERDHELVLVSGYYLIAMAYLKSIPRLDASTYLNTLCEMLEALPQHLTGKAWELCHVALGELLKRILQGMGAALFTQDTRLMLLCSRCLAAMQKHQDLNWESIDILPKPLQANTSLAQLIRLCLDKVQSVPPAAQEALAELEVLTLAEEMPAFHQIAQTRLYFLAYDLFNLGDDAQNELATITRGIKMISASSFSTTEDAQQRLKITKLNTLVRDSICQRGIPKVLESIATILSKEHVQEVTDKIVGGCTIDWLFWLSCESLTEQQEQHIVDLFDLALQRTITELEGTPTDEIKTINCSMLLMALHYNRDLRLSQFTAMLSEYTDVRKLIDSLDPPAGSSKDTACVAPSAGSLTIASLFFRHLKRRGNADAARPLIQQLVSKAVETLRGLACSSPRDIYEQC